MFWKCFKDAPRGCQDAAKNNPRGSKTPSRRLQIGWESLLNVTTHKMALLVNVLRPFAWGQPGHFFFTRFVEMLPHVYIYIYILSADPFRGLPGVCCYFPPSVSSPLTPKTGRQTSPPSPPGTLRDKPIPHSDSGRDILKK